MQARALVVVAAGALSLVASLNAGSSAVPAGNLVQNAGGEAGPGQTSTSNNDAVRFIPAGWEWSTVPEKDAGFVATRYGSHPYFPSRAVSSAIGGGSNFLWAGYPLQRSIATQVLDVGGAATEIDGGRVRGCLSGYLGSLRKNPDSSIGLTLEFLDADGARLAQTGVAPVRGATLSETTLLRRNAERIVPKGTRQLRVVLTGQRPVSGGAIYGYADNIAVALTQGACEPVLVTRCAKGALTATVTPSDVARTRRVQFVIRGATGMRTVNDKRAPFVARIPTAGMTGRLTVTATVTQAGGGPIALTKKSRRC